MSEVSKRHFGTGAKVSFGHFSTILAGLDSLVVLIYFTPNSQNTCTILVQQFQFILFIFFAKWRTALSV